MRVNMIHPKDKIRFAKTLRRSQTDAEKFLWNKLRNRQLEGIKFRRQEPIGKYFVDFVSIEKKVVVELDGGQHNEENVHDIDKKRDEWLVLQGFRVLRFWNNDVFNNIDGILFQIINSISPHPDPLP